MSALAVGILSFGLSSNAHAAATATHTLSLTVGLVEKLATGVGIPVTIDISHAAGAAHASTVAATNLSVSSNTTGNSISQTAELNEGTGSMSAGGVQGLDITLGFSGPPTPATGELAVAPGAGATVNWNPAGTNNLSSANTATPVAGSNSLLTGFGTWSGLINLNTTLVPDHTMTAGTYTLSIVHTLSP